MPMLILLTSLRGEILFCHQGGQREKGKEKQKTDAKAPSTGILRKIMVLVEHKQATFILFKKIFENIFY